MGHQSDELREVNNIVSLSYVFEVQFGTRRQMDGEEKLL